MEGAGGYGAHGQMAARLVDERAALSVPREGDAGERHVSVITSPAGPPGRGRHGRPRRRRERLTQHVTRPDARL